MSASSVGQDRVKWTVHTRHLPLRSAGRNRSCRLVLRDPARMNDLLAAKTRLSGGLFTAADALACGYDRQSLHRLSTKGTVVGIGRGAYAARSALAETSQEQRHRLATRAVVHRFAGRVAASHYSALVVLGLPVWHACLDRVHVARTSNGPNRRLLLSASTVTTVTRHVSPSTAPFASSRLSRFSGQRCSAESRPAWWPRTLLWPA
jgi:hypothetical protein